MNYTYLAIQTTSAVVSLWLLGSCACGCADESDCHKTKDTP